MNILFRDFENPTILLPENTGYLYELLEELLFCTLLYLFSSTNL